MKFFVKAKFPPVDVKGNVMTPERKQRFSDRDNAFAFAQQMLDDGATSITIRPEQDAS
jgi:hypothetical protein